MYDITITLQIPFEEAKLKIVLALKEQGFGILTEINVKETFKKKLDIDFDKYIILGACNPPYALKTLEYDRKIGLLLPCNVCIWENDKTVTISAMDPEVVFSSLIKDKKVEEIAHEIKIRLKKALDSLHT